jgi:hypothetical protein
MVCKLVYRHVTQTPTNALIYLNRHFISTIRNCYTLQPLKGILQGLRQMHFNSKVNSVSYQT